MSGLSPRELRRRKVIFWIGTILFLVLFASLYLFTKPRQRPALRGSLPCRIIPALEVDSNMTLESRKIIEQAEIIRRQVS